jgi:hypothetical protein
MGLWLTKPYFVPNKRPLINDRHCEHGEAIQKTWIAAPPIAARDDEINDLQIALVVGRSTLPKEPGNKDGLLIHQFNDRLQTGAHP